MPAHTPAKVFIVDDDASVRRSLARLVNSAGYQAQAFANAEEFITHELYDGIGCIVLDVQLPGLSGMELQQSLHAANESLPVIFVSGHGDIPTSVQAMKLGAVDFLTKPVEDTALLAAIESALARCQRILREKWEVGAVQRRFDTLTPREREVMALVVRGWLNKRIAHKLGTVEKTIKVHRSRVMEKMEVDSLAELVRLAAKIGIPHKS